MKHSFRSIKDGIFDAALPPKADPKRVGLVSARLVTLRVSTPAVGEFPPARPVGAVFRLVAVDLDPAATTAGAWVCIVCQARRLRQDVGVAGAH